MTESHQPPRRITRLQDIAYMAGVILTVVFSNEQLSRRTETSISEAVLRLERENRELHQRTDETREDLERIVEAIKKVHPECRGLP